MHGLAPDQVRKNIENLRSDWHQKILRNSRPTRSMDPWPSYHQAPWDRCSSGIIFFSVCQRNISISWATFYSESSFIAIHTTILSWSRFATTPDIPIRIASYVLSGVALFPFATLCIDCSCEKCHSKKFHRENIKNLKNYFWPNDPRKSNNIDQVTFVKFSWSRSREKSSKISITVFQ